MDILEIRKKAREQKESAEGEAAAAGQAGTPETAPEAVPPVDEAAPPAGKKRARRKPVKRVVEEQPPAEPIPTESPETSPEESLKESTEEPHGQAVQGPVPPVSLGARVEAEETPAEAKKDSVEYMAFMLAKEEYAVRVEDVKEIIRPQKITGVPRAPDFVMGIISLRGVVLPVFDIRRRLGLPVAERSRSTRILVVSDGGSPQGIIVDKVTGVVRLPEGGVEPPPAVIGGVDAEYLDGVGRVGDRLLIIFNLGRVLAVET